MYRDGEVSEVSFVLIFRVSISVLEPLFSLMAARASCLAKSSNPAI